jgi:hypothetical protein
VLAVLSPAPLRAQDRTEPPRWELGVTAHTDARALHWNIGFDAVPRDVSSELEYRDMRVSALAADAIIRLHASGGNVWSLRIRTRTGAVRSGSGRDSDYRGWDRTGEYSRSVFQVGGSHAGYDLALGTRRPAPVAVIDEVTVWVGYGRDRFDLRKTDGAQVIPSDAPPDLLDGLDSWYRTRRAGPWIALEPAADIGRTRIALLLASHLRTGFTATGEWNLRDDLEQPVSFTQRASGRGAHLRLSARRPLARHAALLASAEHRRDRFAGIDRAYLATGTVAPQNLHEVVDRSLGVSAGISVSF